MLITNNLTIDASSIGGITIDGHGNGRIFEIAANTTNTMIDLTLTNGLASNGGAIYVGNGAMLTLSNATISGNFSSGDGGGIVNYNGTVTLNNTTLSGNHATGSGGGIYSALSTTLNQCTLANNTADISGGGIDNESGWTFMTNCTVSGNIATNGTGAGVQTYGDTYTETVVANSIIAGNLGGGDIWCQKTSNPNGFLSGGYNLIGSGTVAYFSNTGDSTNQTASSIRLAALGNYGGPTPTMPPLPGSPAIDAGGSTHFNTDQRGAPRFDGLADSGAVESESIVRNTNNDGNGSLRSAIHWASSVNPITFATNLTGQTILLTSGQLTVNRSLTIDASAIGGITIDGNGTVTSNRVMEVTPTATAVVLNALTIIHGYSLNGGGIYNDRGTLTISNSTFSGNSVYDNYNYGAGYGGGIYNDGTLTLENTTISTNYSIYNGGGIYNNGTLTLNNTTLSTNSAYYNNGGGIYNDPGGALTVSNSTISGNTAGNYGGGIYSYYSTTLRLNNITLSTNRAYSGGGIYNNGTLTVNNTTLSGNLAYAADGGGILNAGTLTINNTTLSGNDAYGGGIYNDLALMINNTTLSGNYAYIGGGGIENAYYSLLILNNSTLSGNKADGTGGGIYIDASSGTFMTNCTVSGNTSPIGAGVQTYGDTNSLTAVANSIIAGNSGGNDLGIDTNSNPQAFLSGGYNLIGSGTVSNFTNTGDSTNQTASSIALAPLGSYGGPTQTMPPLPGSPAIDAGGTTTLTSDQRGFARLAGAHVDIGAVEIQRSSDTATILSSAWSTDQDGDGNPFGVEWALDTDWNTTDGNNPANLSSVVSNSAPGVAFGFNPLATNTTDWIILRSLDLTISNSWSEIFRYDGPTGTTSNAVPVSTVESPTNITVFDDSGATNAFYRFEAVQSP